MIYYTCAYLSFSRNEYLNKTKEYFIILIPLDNFYIHIYIYIYIYFLNDRYYKSKTISYEEF